MKLNRNASILFLVIYGIITLSGRLWIESALNMGIVNSLMIGVFFIMFIVLLFRFGFLTLKE